MTFHTRASSRCHHQFHFMAGIFQRPGSICIFKTLLMAWENCIFSVFLGTTLPISSPTLWASAYASSVPRNHPRYPEIPRRGQSKPIPHWRSSGDPQRQGGLGGGCGQGGHSCG